VGKPGVKSPLGRPRLRWEDIKMDLERNILGGRWLRIGTSVGLL
jgi:hypothetical protein